MISVRRIMAIVLAFVTTLSIAFVIAPQAQAENKDSKTITVIAALPKGCSQKAKDLVERKWFDDGEFAVTISCKDSAKVSGMGVPQAEFRRCLDPLSGIFRACKHWSTWSKAKYAGAINSHNRISKTSTSTTHWSFTTLVGSYRYEGRARPEVLIKSGTSTVRIKSKDLATVAGSISNNATQLQD